MKIAKTETVKIGIMELKVILSTYFNVTLDNLHIEIEQNNTIIHVVEHEQDTDFIISWIESYEHK
jgi:hypothetical protein